MEMRIKGKILKHMCECAEIYTCGHSCIRIRGISPDRPPPVEQNTTDAVYNECTKRFT